MRSAAIGLGMLLGLLSACAESEDGGGGGPGGGDPTPADPAVVGPLYTLEAEVSARLEAGDDFAAIADWLATQPGVTFAAAGELGLRYTHEDGDERWWYTPDGPAVSTSSVVLPPDPGRELVVREGGGENEDKRALVLAPFRFQFGPDLVPWVQRLRETRDYAGRVTYVEGAAVGDRHFSDWGRYRTILISTHGTTLPASDGGQATALFSSRPCGLTGWIAAEVAAGRGNIQTHLPGKTVADLKGLPLARIRQALTRDMWTSALAFVEADRRALREAGKICSVLRVPIDELTSSGPTRRAGDLEFVAYTERWFARQQKLAHSVLLLGACDSAAFQPPSDDLAPFAFFGWDKPVSNRGSIRAQDIFLEALIGGGRTIDEAFGAVRRAGAHRDTWTGPAGRPITAELLERGDSGVRIREIIAMTLPGDDAPLPLLDAALPAARVRTSGGQTVTEVDLGLRIDGLTNDTRRNAEIVVETADGTEVYRNARLDAPDADGRIRLVARVSLPVDASRTPASVELVAKLELPEDDQQSRHRRLMQILPSTRALWSLDVGDRSFSGDLVSSPTAQPTVAPDGSSGWAVALSQTDEPGFPVANLYLLEHSGRRMDCTGDTGTFGLFLGITESAMPMRTYLTPSNDMDCVAEATIEVQTFSQAEGMTARIQGTICEGTLDPGGNFTVVARGLNGQLTLPEAGCGQGMTGADFVGSYTSADAAGLCTDVYENATFALAWNQLCAMSGGTITCAPTMCPTQGVIGTCDLRGSSVQDAFRGTVQYFSSTFGSTRAELEMTCALQNGVWTSM